MRARRSAPNGIVVDSRRRRIRIPRRSALSRSRPRVIRVATLSASSVANLSPQQARRSIRHCLLRVSRGAWSEVMGVRGGIRLGA
eukprot:scaffold22279_cov123-Isochrysis_galbana.AAC.1